MVSCCVNEMVNNRDSSRRVVTKVPWYYLTLGNSYAHFELCVYSCIGFCCLGQRTLTYYIRGNITIRLTSCLTGFDSAVLLKRNYKQICLFGQILTGQTGGQLYSDISPYKVSECSLLRPYRCTLYCTNYAFTTE